MDITEVSILHHVGFVLFVLWLLAQHNCCYPVAYFVSLIYLYLVHERYVMRLRKKLQFEERKQSNQRRVLSDSETVRWLNHALEKIWPICIEQIASQKILLPIIPWFLEKYKPWTAKEAVVQHLYLGRNAPMLTDIRVVRESNDDDHLVLELGLNFLTADDMIAILAVKLRKRLGFGMWAKLHITGMHVEGKLLIGVKFLRRWPFLGRLRICFIEPPYFQMTVKPIFTHGLDVTVLPGIAGWLEKLLSIAFEQTLVEPNMLVVDMEKFASPQQESWFSVNEKESLGHVRVEVIEASDIKAADLNGLSDPYVKGQLGLYRFRTKTQKKTLAPKWHEEFKMPIITWDSSTVLSIEVRDKDRFVDDCLGFCCINIGEYRDGQRHDMWLPLQNIKTGRIHLAVTVVEDNPKGGDNPNVEETPNVEDERKRFANDTSNKSSFSSASSEKFDKVADNFEPIDVDGQRETGIWVHHPGSEVSQTWESRKGKSRLLDNEIQNDTGGHSSVTSVSPTNEDSGTEKNHEDKHRMRAVRKGLNRICSVFHKNSKKENDSSSFRETVGSGHANIQEISEKDIAVRFIVEDDLSNPQEGKGLKEEGVVTSGGSGSKGKGKGKGLDKAKSFLKPAKKSSRDFRKCQSDSYKGRERKTLEEFNSTDEDDAPPKRLK
ncbi:C2 domain-containing protein At1g53590 isoform X1 [Rosa chinensis]|uniref:C2 domain-containing protein At1g53590 isoform X1 n=1 Tax=Rosa chinensis TaxID=74649 RepID=UPI000D08CD89|nr:C2 domain-containing protein At1g53590 isoform X1 [Rosa chinensis]